MQILTLLALALAVWSWCRPVPAALRIGDLAALIAGLGGFSLLVRGEVLPAFLAIAGASLWIIKRRQHGSIRKKTKKNSFRASFSSAYAEFSKNGSYQPYQARKPKSGVNEKNYQQKSSYVPPRNNPSYAKQPEKKQPASPSSAPQKPDLKINKRADVLARIHRLGVPKNRTEALHLFELSEKADKVTIKKSYHQLIALVHPDAGGTEELARYVNVARDILLKFNPR
ncbi:MAG: molecular chaperone DnaJ [Zymomonas mobilis subsp. pomaceae]|uniref:Heat shock protein DnaJ domain protein n=1 Tax=Zymomonas mobilis subsp. pomaceae (strain ATCC 29192 / DSM 22645 / JCM 10191 / CCUG 17912 / NBRC 13757 / NCIMB 11200 / NRRL B-4491 / Barker I) TaxID=579138 RepID=F8ESI2_ZYMMT|nr:molecular chaperone DnaJ [Zymomonas mobilis]AEI37757.1 heat shock protein DnaJ domain protein [Zymomonas mobilis subsp. pomaceae ATCC 29192]MDX5949124.1 molecular chaperone DnaJ [Zymomonas mobilis subsp. pomaceae]GEB88931.1 hypothetical protein ZMO02_05680 [Zymomonas mobilis subsp. pomaceae]